MNVITFQIKAQCQGSFNNVRNLHDKMSMTFANPFAGSFSVVIFFNVIEFKVQSGSVFFCQNRLAFVRARIYKTRKSLLL